MPKEEKKIKTPTVEEIDLDKTDVLLLKGSWSDDMISDFAEEIGKTGKQVLMVALPEDQDIASLGIKEFYTMLKEVKKRVQGD
jgi:hypothetical protein